MMYEKLEVIILGDATEVIQGSSTNVEPGGTEPPGIGSDD